MPHRHWLNIYRALALLAVLASALLYIHYLDPVDSNICGGASGCEKVRGSGFSYYKSPYVNVPLVGMLAYGFLLLDALGPATASRLSRVRWMAGVGGILALGLVVVQALVVKAFCWLCLVVDVAGVGAAFAAVFAHASEAEPKEVLTKWSWAGLLAAAVALPLVWYAVKPVPDVPRLVKMYYEPDKINVIEFADFQCPHCRRLHPTLESVVEEYGERVHFKRLNMPLPSHSQAIPAARAYLCADAEGKGEEMADRLFEGELGPEHYAEYARELGLDGSAFEACTKDAETDKKLGVEVAVFRQSGLRGLPTTFVGKQRIGGARPRAVYVEAIEKAASAEEPFSLSGPAVLGGSAMLLMGLVWFGRRRDP